MHIARVYIKRKLVHKIAKLQEPPTRNIPRLNVKLTPCTVKIQSAYVQSKEANMDDLYLIINFCRKTNFRDHEKISLTRVFFQKNLQFLTKVNQVPACPYYKLQYSN